MQRQLYERPFFSVPPLQGSGGFFESEDRCSTAVRTHTLALSTVHRRVWGLFQEFSYEPLIRAGYRVLGVAVQDSRGALRGLSESMGLTFPMVLDGDNSVGMAYHVVGPPSTFFIDANGKIISVVAGQIEEDTLEQELAKLLG